MTIIDYRDTRPGTGSALLMSGVRNRWRRSRWAGVAQAWSDAGPSWREAIADEIDDFAHGAAGGFLFGIPLLYTMEFWLGGPKISMLHALVLVALSVGISLIFVATIGFREAEPL